MIAVDSSVWVDFFRGVPTPQVDLLSAQLDNYASDVALVDIGLTEVLRGLRDEDVDRVEQTLLDLTVLRTQSPTDFSAAAALYRSARKAGITIRSTADCLIAVVCIREAAPLLHCDADFDRLADISELSTVRIG